MTILLNIPNEQFKKDTENIAVLLRQMFSNCMDV